MSLCDRTVPTVQTNILSRIVYHCEDILHIANHAATERCLIRIFSIGLSIYIKYCINSIHVKTESSDPIASIFVIKDIHLALISLNVRRDVNRELKSSAE